MECTALSLIERECDLRFLAVWKSCGQQLTFFLTDKDIVNRICWQAVHASALNVPSLSSGLVHSNPLLRTVRNDVANDVFVKLIRLRC